MLQGKNFVAFWNTSIYQICFFRFGHFEVAKSVIDHVVPCVSSEQMYFWLKGLSQVFEGERILNDISNSDVIDRISNANAKLILGSSSIKAATPTYKNQEFQIGYCKLIKIRLNFLKLQISL